MRGLCALLLVLAVLAAGPGATQTAAGAGSPAADAPALLVADKVFVTADNTLIAEGNVEAIQGDIRLRAPRIVFDLDARTLSIDGPIRIDQGDTTTILASSAEMDEGLRNGLLSGARLILGENLQLAAVQMTRVKGRYTQLDKASVTSCRIDTSTGTPLWQIRARRVIHDSEERQIYFEGAQFRVLDVPVFYFPRLRLPDPTLDRASGFLIPRIRTTSQLGTGVRVPYFFTLGDRADLTLAPYVSPKTRTLGLRYRQAFKHGRVSFEGAYTRDDLRPGNTRGYLFGQGLFDLRRNFQLSFDIRTVSDNAYLLDYGLEDLDRLQSEIAISRVRRDSFFRTGLIHFNSLRDGEDESTLPTLVADANYERRFFPSGIGGELRLGLDAHGHYRSSSVDILGRDIDRTSADIRWLRSWIGPTGLRADAQLGFAADLFGTHGDSNFNRRGQRATPSAAMALRYPMLRHESTGGGTQFLEPVAQVAWSHVTGDPVPNDESRFVEFDQGNLLALSRFPATDRREDGLVMAYGLNWSRFSPSGWQASASVGQVFRRTADPNFTSTSGLSGTSSDFLVAGQFTTGSGLSMTTRTLFDAAFSFSKAELRGDWTTKRAALTGTYLWLQADLAESRPNKVSEIWFDGRYDVAAHWSAKARWRYDVADNRATTAGIGLLYSNQCVEVDVSLNRRYTSSTSVEPSTDFGFTIALRGFSVASGTQKYRRSCS